MMALCVLQMRCSLGFVDADSKSTKPTHQQQPAAEGFGGADAVFNVWPVFSVLPTLRPKQTDAS
jgi:hypothetical protein